MPESDSPYLVRAVVRALDILAVLQKAPTGVGFADLVDAVGLPKSSLFRYLLTLETRGYVEKDVATGRYRLGRQSLPWHIRSVEAIAVVARPFLEDLRDRFGETLNLGVLDGNRVAYVEIVESPRTMRLSARKGDRDPIHSTALGKALASQLPEERVLEILAAQGMPQRTSRTITTPDAFLAELDVVRAQGYAVDNGENEEDGRCVAVPLPDPRPTAAISLGAPAVRFPIEGAALVAEALNHAVQQIAHSANEDPRETH